MNITGYLLAAEDAIPPVETLSRFDVKRVMTGIVWSGSMFAAYTVPNVPYCYRSEFVLR